MIRAALLCLLLAGCAADLPPRCKPGEELTWSDSDRGRYYYCARAQ